MVDPFSDQDSPHLPTTANPSREGKAPQARLPEHISKYHIKRVIDSGGMGTVFEATQENPRRVVAVKVMKQGIASKSALRRFEYEGQILGRLRHPGIAQIFEAGMHTDREGLLGPAGASIPFFAMEYIPNAKPITMFADEKSLSTRERMALFAKVCDAIHHGHQKGIIHRDLKPSNILVDSGGQARIIDFGVARSTDSDLAITTLQTDVGQLIGTLQYMSPEQCEADPHDIDIRSDVYSLGVVFYELLCRKVPYDIRGMPIHQATWVIRDQTPTKLSTLDKTLRGDVETIALKALEKERERRYQSTADFAHDIQRYLDGEAILAHRASIVYQLRVFARRNKAVFASLAAVFIVLVAGMTGTLGMYLRATRERAEAIRQREIASSQSEFLGGLLSSASPTVAQGKTLTVKELVDRAAKSLTKGSRHPLVAAWLHRTLSDTYFGLGEFELAEQHARASVEIYQRELGDVDPETLIARQWLAACKSRRGDHAEADPLLRFALAESLRMNGPEHDETRAARLNLAQSLQRQLQNDEAEKLLRENLDIDRRLFGEKNPSTLNTMQNLGFVLIQQEAKLAEAELLIRETYESYRQLMGAENMMTLTTAHSLAMVLFCVGKLDEALAIAERNLEARKRIYGNDHYKTVASAEVLAWIQLDRGELDLAEGLARENLIAFSRILGPHHMGTAQAFWHVFRVLVAQGKTDEAKGLAREMLEQPAQHGWRFMYNALAWELLRCEPRESRDSVMALQFAQRAAELIGDSQPSIILPTLALAHHLSGHADEAVQAQERALALLPKEGRPVEFTETYLTLVWVLIERSQHEKAELVLADAVARLSTGSITPRQNKEIAKHFVKLYESWDAAEPGKGYAEKAAEWRAKLDETSRSRNDETGKP